MLVLRPLLCPAKNIAEAVNLIQDLFLHEGITLCAKQPQTELPPTQGPLLPFPLVDSSSIRLLQRTDARVVR